MRDMAEHYAARYVSVMLPRMIALAVALACSLATNIWLATRAPGVVQASAAPAVQCEPASAAVGDENAPSLASFARVVEEAKRARAATNDVARNDARDERARA